MPTVANVIETSCGTFCTVVYRGLSLSRWCCFVLEFSISVFGMFLEYKVSKKQGSGKAHIRNLPPKKEGKQQPWTWSSMGPFNAAKDYVVQHAPCDVGIIKVDSNDPVTRPAGGKYLTRDASVEKTAVSLIFPKFWPVLYGGLTFPLG